MFIKTGIPIRKIFFLLLVFSCATGRTAGRKRPFYVPETSGDVLYRTGYCFEYSEKHEQPLWVAYELTSEEVNGQCERSDNFREDPEILSGSASTGDYRNSGYDRGHLAPAGDMKWSEEAMGDSFYMSNMSPQRPSFNRGIWKELEERVRDWALDNEKVYVVTGGVLNGNFIEFIGENHVAAPNYYFKVVLDYTDPEKKGIGFVLPNKKIKSALLSEYASNIDYVEKVTGINFFPLMTEDEAGILEKEYDPEKWGF